jgi:hypothetical protein
LHEEAAKLGAKKNRSGQRTALPQGNKKPLGPAALKARIAKIAPPDPALRAIRREAKRKGTDNLTMRQINAEIAAHRREENKK